MACAVDERPVPADGKNHVDLLSLRREALDRLTGKLVHRLLHHPAAAPVSGHPADDLAGTLVPVLFAQIGDQQNIHQ